VLTNVLLDSRAGIQLFADLGVNIVPETTNLLGEVTLEGVEVFIQLLAIPTELAGTHRKLTSAELVVDVEVVIELEALCSAVVIREGAEVPNASTRTFHDDFEHVITHVSFSLVI
jgi:hypothetical protein